MQCTNSVSGSYRMLTWCHLQGIKLEAFIFDPLPIADNLVLMEVDRSAHFAPVKNANGAKADTPAIAKGAVLALHKRSTRLHSTMALSAGSA